MAEWTKNQQKLWQFSSHYATFCLLSPGIIQFKIQQNTTTCSKTPQETILPRETEKTMLPLYFLTSLHTLEQSIFETISKKGARNPTCETEALLLPVCVLVDLRAQNLLHEVLRIGAMYAPRCRVGTICHSSSHSSAPLRAHRSSKPYLWWRHALLCLCFAYRLDENDDQWMIIIHFTTNHGRDEFFQ